MMLWLAGENCIGLHAALGGWDLATERNGDNDAQWKAARSRAGLYLRAGGTKAIEKALGKNIADVSDDKLRLLAGVGGVANAMKMLRVERWRTQLVYLTVL
jgi:hypothetical protein